MNKVAGFAVLGLAFAMIVSAVPANAHHVPRIDDRIVEPAGVPVMTHIPIVAGYEPVPKPAQCGYTPAIADPIFEEDFEDGHSFSFYDTSLAVGSANLWSPTTWPGPGEEAEPGNTVMHFGNADTGTYWAFHPAGVAATPWIELPDTPSQVSFETKWETEYLAGYDHMFIEAETGDGEVHLLCTTNAVPRADPAGKNGQSNWPACSPYQNPCSEEQMEPLWETRSVAIPQSLWGEEIRLRFTFDASDSAANGYMGWMIDDVAIGAPAG